MRGTKVDDAEYFSHHFERLQNASKLAQSSSAQWLNSRHFRNLSVLQLLPHSGFVIIESRVLDD